MKVQLKSSQEQILMLLKHKSSCLPKRFYELKSEAKLRVSNDLPHLENSKLQGKIRSRSLTLYHICQRIFKSLASTGFPFVTSKWRNVLKALPHQRIYSRATKEEVASLYSLIERQALLPLTPWSVCAAWGMSNSWTSHIPLSNWNHYHTPEFLVCMHQSGWSVKSSLLSPDIWVDNIVP